MPICRFIHEHDPDSICTQQLNHHGRHNYIARCDAICIAPAGARCVFVLGHIGQHYAPPLAEPEPVLPEPFESPGRFAFRKAIAARTERERKAGIPPKVRGEGLRVKLKRFIYRTGLGYGA